MRSANELRTEALRILVPAVTALVEERRVSFASALRLGISQRYGGEPDHLRIDHTSMPVREGATGDGASREGRRNFVVIYDSQPSGTGYLQRLADPEEMRGVLAAARDKKPTPLDLYDSLTMSAVVGVSEQSIAQGGAPLPFPDFTRGRWQTAKPYFAL